MSLAAGSCTTSGVVAALRTQYPDLEALLPRCALSVNGEFADGEAPLKANDEVAVLPPMSGG